MDTACSRENGGTAGSERQANQARARNFERRFAVGRDLHDSALAGKRRGDIEISVRVESQTLRASQATEVNRHGTVRINPVNRIEAGSRGSRHEEIALRTDRQMVSGNTGLERSEHKNLAVARDFENGAAAVSHV